MASKKMIYVGAVSVLVVVIVLVGLSIIQRRSFRNQSHISAEPAPPPSMSTAQDSSTDKDSKIAEPRSSPVPGNSIRVTMIDMKAIETNDGGLTGDADEV